ncbi:MAG: radical SAM protein [Fimbriimonadales bacterium]
MCPQCHAEGLRSDDPNAFVDGMLVSKNGSIWMRRYCNQHGESESLYEEDAEIWRSRRGWSTPTLQVTPDRADNVGGFPAAYSKGLPASHAQHTCILLLNVTERCNFKCPTCYASALPPEAPGEHEGPSIDEIEATVRTVIEREGGKLGVLMLSGGEPTVRKDLPQIIERVAKLPITRVMINTNGRRIARDPSFLSFLPDYRDRIEIYLQYDGLEAEGSLKHRGEDVREEKAAVLAKLNDARIFTTLVTTVARGVNDHEVGAMLNLGLSTPYCAGIAFQPMFGSGRAIAFDPMSRSTPTGVIRDLESQSGVVSATDFIPLPCSHRDCCDITYLLKTKKGEWKSIPSLIGRDELAKWIHLVSNTISFDGVSESIATMLKSGALQKVFSEQLKVGAPDLALQIASMCNCIPGLNDLLGMMWKRSVDEEAMALNTFRITVKMFMDSHTFHEARIRQCCVHTGTFEDDPRRYSFCWRWLFDDASDTPAATIRRDSIGIK